MSAAVKPSSLTGAVSPMIPVLVCALAIFRAEAQYLIPTEYSAFVWAIALGWSFFDEAAAWTSLTGACLIVAGCLVAARANPKLAEPIEATV